MTTIRIFIRTDASLHIGSGHVMRCLTLAETLKANGVDVQFICRKHPGNLNQEIERNRFVVNQIPHTKENAIEDRLLGDKWQKDAEFTAFFLNDYGKEIDWLIVDHYSIDRCWEKTLAKYVKYIMVIDDLANRPHACDLLLDQNFYFQQDRYQPYVSKNCILLIGPSYALLRNQFLERGHFCKEKGLNRILVFFGGVDINNETEKALNAIQSFSKENLQVDVVLGLSNPHKKRLKGKMRSMEHVNCHIGVSNMAQLMMKADLSIGGGGTTTWERCCLGLPSVVLALSENQVQSNEDLAAKRIIHYLGKSFDVTEDDLVKTLRYYHSFPDELLTLGRRSRTLVDGLGVKKVTNMLEHISKGLPL